MSESEMNMHLPVSPHQPSPSPSPSSSTPPSEIYARYPAKLARRMQEETCYRCKQQGHWSWDCPLNSPNAKSLSPSPNHASNYPNIWCRCGHGFCEVKTVSNNNNKNNCGKKYYSCPIKRGKKCRDFVKWCDGGNIDESDLQPPLYKYPECVCGAGVCRKEKGTERPYGGEYYFTCPVKENHGSCGYRVWEDELLDNNKAIVPIQQSSERTHVSSENNQNEETDYDMVNGRDLLSENLKRVSSKKPSSVVVSELPEREDASLKAAPSKCVGFSDFEVADYLQVLEFANSVSREAIKEEPFLLSPSRICGQQSLFQGHIFADASFGVFPSFNPIDVPKQVSIGDDPCGSSQLAENSLSQQTQISTSCDTEGDAVTPNKSPSSERKPLSKAERRRQMVLVALQQLLIDLETLDPNEQREAAKDAFDMLDKLGVNYKQFSEHIWDYIDLASSIAEMDKSMENSLTLDEYNKRFEEEKVRFARVQDDCFSSETLLEASNQRRQSLIEEISHLEVVLYEKQTQLKSCELENLQIETHLGELRRSLMEADTTLKVTAEEAKIARQLNEERQAKHISAKTAMEKAKLELEN